MRPRELEIRMPFIQIPAENIKKRAILCLHDRAKNDSRGLHLELGHFEEERMQQEEAVGQRLEKKPREALGSGGRMIKKVFIENFRGIEKQELAFGRVNFLTGPNNSGKSSVIYALLALKNLVVNPNQSLDGFLNLGFLSLGGFSQAVHLKDEKRHILLGVGVERARRYSEFRARLGKQDSSLKFSMEEPTRIDLDLEVTFPYSATATTGVDVPTESGKLAITWNGISANLALDPGSSGDEEELKRLSNEISAAFNNPPEELRSLDFVPVRRGFMKPSYSSVPLQPQLLNDDELATLLATDRDLEGKVAFYLEKVLDRTFSVRPTLGTANFNLQSRDRSSGFVCDLVNEGFGTNQLVTILAKTLRKEVSTICIEETEIHLHPQLMERFTSVLLEIAYDEKKQFVITTHSEHIVSAALTKAFQKKMEPLDLKLFYLHRERRGSVIEEQRISENGQVEGGLKSFYETGITDVKEFFQADDE
jgi:predicted ATPase